MSLHTHQQLLLQSRSPPSTSLSRVETSGAYMPLGRAVGTVAALTAPAFPVDFICTGGSLHDHCGHSQSTRRAAPRRQPMGPLGGATEPAVHEPPFVLSLTVRLMSDALDRLATHLHPVFFVFSTSPRAARPVLSHDMWSRDDPSPRGAPERSSVDLHPAFDIDVLESQPWGASSVFFSRAGCRPSQAGLLWHRGFPPARSPLSLKRGSAAHTTPGTTPPSSGRHVVTMQWGDDLRNGSIAFLSLPVGGCRGASGVNRGWHGEQHFWSSGRGHVGRLGLVLREGPLTRRGATLPTVGRGVTSTSAPFFGPVQTGKESRRSPLPLRPITGGDDPVCLFTASARDARGRASLAGRACGSGRHTG